MKMQRCYFLLVLGLICASASNVDAGKRGKKNKANWPSFRGAHAQGVADGFALPVSWDVPASEGVRWKTSVPGLSHSSPVIWGDHLFVTTVTSDQPDPLLKVGLYGASPDHPESFEHRYELYCLDKNTGDVKWSRVALSAVPKVKRHIKATHANCTPSTDGQFVVAFFGSQGLFCFDMSGDLIWKQDFGMLDAGPPGHDDLQWGFASSPVIYDDHVYVQCDARNNAFVAALRLSDGEEVWRTARVEEGTWSTPTIYSARKHGQVIVNGYKHIGGYDLKTGEELWKLSGGGDIPVPTPVVANKLIYITNAHGAMAPIYAIRVNAKGDLTTTELVEQSPYMAWKIDKGGAYMQSPLVYKKLLYNCRDNGVL
ncbi:MAG: PQQ-binding-like beta-propeller repeat protein, partial [Phycisphaerae bacterium]